MKTEIEVAYEDAIDASNELGFACMTAGDVIRYQADELVELREALEEPFQLVFEGYNRPGTDFASDAAWATWQHAQLTKAFNLLQKIRKGPGNGN